MKKFFVVFRYRAVRPYIPPDGCRTALFLFWEGPTLLRTWEDLEVLAYDLFGNDADDLQHHLGRHRLTRNQLLYYCNWVHGMTQEELAAEFGVTQPAVSDSLGRLRFKWPDLFRFVRPNPMFRYEPEKHDKYVLHTF